MQALWMVLAAFFFAGMAVCVKFASTSFSSFELVFFRGLVSLAFMAVVLRASGTPWRTPVPLMHLTRSIIGATSLGAWFYAIAHLPVATAMTLNYMSGVWIAAFIVGGSLLYGGQEKQGALLVTVLMGFAGVVMTLHPTIEKDQLFAGVVGLLSGISAAMAYMQVTALGKAGEPETRTVFYFSLGTIAVGAISLPLGKHTDWTQAALAGGGLDPPHRRAGLAGATGHDPRLPQGFDAGGGQHAVLGHCVCGPVWRAADGRGN